MTKIVSFKKTRGFTLLEVIVTLVIASLISVILMQSMSTMLNMRHKFSKGLIDLEKVSIQKSIITTPISGIFPDYNDGDNRFKGNSSSIRGLTLYPLQGTTGAPTAFGIDIIYDSTLGRSTLIYKEHGFETLEIARWNGNEGSFEYLGINGRWSKRWPLGNDPNTQTPRSVKLSSGAIESSYVIRVVTTSDRSGRLQDSPFRLDTKK
tara:strand:- start:75 stop:695 length:621 start_codon:yes stop_codon:yes gene_type:complete